ncbi:type VII secretion system-associated protein [Nocardia amamiensis]|uniref:type VII secretion system-associated protein n=1 Tax=Nocardia amamiensis TaxID=404578 RepID=UPI0008305026|nr:type VII secretion system-associated protein [Nocardia amamiensis]
MKDPASNVVQHGDWLVLVDPSWQETTPEVLPPPEVILGGWMVGEDGVPGPFEPNPNYLPVDDWLPTDPLDAVLRRVAADADVDGGEIIAALRDAVVEIGCDSQDNLLVGPAPDGVPCVAVATAAVHKHRVEAERWWPVLGATLPDIVPAGVDILLNPGSPAQFRLLTDSLRPIG